MKNKYEKLFCPTGLVIPDHIARRNTFSIGKKLVAPKELFLDGYLTEVENQGSKPWCAAYSATTFAENILWRKNGYPEQIDPAPIYAWAKAHDGDPNGDGTTLEMALTALLAKGFFDANVCTVKSFGGAQFGEDPDTAILKLKMTLHRHGTCIIGCCIDSSWFTPQKGVIKGGGYQQGGHAITVMGYDADGILIRNSWGSAWGHNGNAYIPNPVFRKQFMYGSCIENVWK